MKVEKLRFFVQKFLYTAEFICVLDTIKAFTGKEPAIGKELSTKKAQYGRLDVSKLFTN
ncbi:hypothetical protein [Bacillus sp. C1]